MSAGTLYQVLGTLVVIAAFFVILGAVVAQIPICGPNSDCASMDYVAVAGGVAVGVVIAGAGGWLIQRGRELGE